MKTSRISEFSAPVDRKMFSLSLVKKSLLSDGNRLRYEQNATIFSPSDPNYPTRLYDELRSEESLFKTAITNGPEANLKSITKFFLQKNFHLALPTMNQLLGILWTIPVNVCECERSFSSLRRIKTYLRNTIGQERLSALALVHVERDILIDTDAIVTEFVAKNGTRKKQFSQ